MPFKHYPRSGVGHEDIKKIITVQNSMLNQKVPYELSEQIDEHVKLQIYHSGERQENEKKKKEKGKSMKDTRMSYEQKRNNRLT
jgi:hypothetical protein